MSKDLSAKERHIGYACSYVPVEIILAGGMTPWRLLPEGVFADADAFIHHATCCHVKGVLSEAIRGKYQHLDGIILANSCDGMRRLADILPPHIRNIPVLFLDIPKKKDPHAISLFASSLRKLIDEMPREFPAMPVTMDRLESAIRECNSIRRHMNDVFNHQKNLDRGVAGSAIFNLCREAGRTSPAAFSKTLKDFIGNIQNTTISSHGPRVVVTGNAFHQPELIKDIEKTGATVAAIDSCIGERHFGTLVKEEGTDPVAALAERYLLKSPCARMEGMDERIKYLETLINESGADGVVCLAPKYCDTLLYELPILKERAGVPFCAVEYDPSGLSVQVTTRLDAFVELLKGGR